MKKFIVFLLLQISVLPTMATGQSGDVIYLDGESWNLLWEPINSDPTVYARLKAFLPERRDWSTANGDGYTAFWEIKNGYLCLKQIEIEILGSIQTYDTEALKKPFAPYYKKKEIRASWFSGEVRAGCGKHIRYVHDGFDRNFETEQILTIQNGKVIKAVTYHNYRIPGLKINEASKIISRRFPWWKFPEYRGKNIVCIICDTEMSKDGHFLDCYISKMYLLYSHKQIEEDVSLIRAIKETLRSIYPWETIVANGKSQMIEYPIIAIGLEEETN